MQPALLQQRPGSRSAESKADLRCQRVSLNGIQQMMLRWEELHPYNAVQFAYVRDSRIDAASLRNALDLLVAELEFSTVSFCKSRNDSLWLNEGTEIPLECQSREELTQTFVESLATHELNRPFDQNNLCPFRVQLIQANDGKLIVFTYRHIVSDAVGVAELMRRTLQLCVTEDTRREWRLAPESTASAEAESGESASVLRRLCAASRQLIWYRNCWRPSTSDPGSWHFQFLLHSNPLSTKSLKASAHQYGATVQELLIAATMEACHRHVVPAQLQSAPLAVSTPVDLRRLANRQYEGRFGQFIGSYAVRSRVEKEEEFASLVRNVREQSQRLRDAGEFLQADNGLRLMASIWDWLPQRVNRSLAQRLFPVAAGISNVNLTDLFGTSRGEVEVCNYFRGTCLGVMIPLMVTLTTNGKTYNLTSTHRTAFFSAAQARSVMQHVASRLAGHTPKQEEPMNSRTFELW